MPKLCHARAPADATEAAQIRKLAQSHHAPHDCKQRAQMIALSWEGLRTGEIACHLRCHPQTVRERFERFQTEGIDGLTDRPVSRALRPAPGRLVKPSSTTLLCRLQTGCRRPILGSHAVECQAMATQCPTV